MKLRFTIYDLRFTRDKGFTIAEAIIAVFIIAIALVGIYAVVTRSLGIGLAFRNELVAANLATEGVEIVRSIRDSNWLESPSKKANGNECSPTNWREGLCNGDRQLDYTVSGSATSLVAYNPSLRLNLDSASGRYSYGAGAPTIFKRKVTLSAPGASATEMQVVVEVRWSGRGGNLCAAPNPDQERCLMVEDRLFNWYGP